MPQASDAGSIRPRSLPTAVGRYALRFDVPDTEGRLEPWVLCALRRMVENGVFEPLSVQPAPTPPPGKSEVTTRSKRRRLKSGIH